MLVRTAALAALVLVTAAAPARADQTGPLTWSVPDGFRVTRTWDGGADLTGPNGATIQVRVGLQGDAALAVARAAVPADASQELREMAIQVCGQPGHLVVRRSGSRSFASAACVPAAGQAISIVLSAAPASYQEGCASWGALVDGGSVSLAPAPRQPRPGQGPGDHREAAPARRQQPAAPRAPVRHWVELRNEATWGEATLYFDGEARTLGPGEGQRIEVTAGSHTFKFQNEDGSWGEGTYEVPRFNRFTGSCPRPAAAPAPEPVADAGDWSDEDYAEGARWYVNLTCFSIYTMKVMDEWMWADGALHDPKHLAPIIAEMRRRREFRDFSAQIPGFWDRVCGLWRDGTPEERYALRREAASFILKNSPGTFKIPGPDGGAGDGIDRLLRQQEREWAQVKLQRRQAQAAATQSALMVENWIFNNTSNAMTFTPSSW